MGSVILVLILSSCSAENVLAPSGGGNEILFNVEEVPFKPDSTAGGAATRATKLTDISSFKLYAYDEGGNAIADGVTYTKSGDSWTSDSKVFWPQTGNVTFYAFSPASNDAVVFDTSKKQLTYTASTAQGSQQDVLYAYKTSERPESNTIDLTFSHANAAFSVNARLASGCTATVNVSGVSLVNVRPTNTLTFSDGSTSVSGDNITSVLACSAKTLTTSNQSISTEPLIIPSQAITAWAGNNAISSQTGTYLAVTCNVLYNGTYVVGSSSANGTVYVPMSKTLNKGEDNSVNLVFGSEGNNGRYYGRKADGTRIFVSNQRTISGVTSADIGKVICTDGTVYNTVSEASAAGKNAAGMIAYISGTGHGLAIALTDASSSCAWKRASSKASSYTPKVSGYSWKLPSKTDWNNMFSGCGGSSENSKPFRNKLTACGGTNVKSTSTSAVYYYWASAEGSSGDVYYYDFHISRWYTYNGGNRGLVRSCLAF